MEKGRGREEGREGERPALSSRPSVLPNHEERVTYEEITHSGPGLPHPCPCGRLWKVSHSEMKEVYVTRVSTRTFWCALGGLLSPLHPPPALWPPGPGQMQVVPSPPTVGCKRTQGYGKRYTDPQLPGPPLPGLTDEQKPFIILLSLEHLEVSESQDL